MKESAEFFALTKRLHNQLHGVAGEGDPRSDEDRGLYETTLAASAEQLTPLVRAGDVVFLHDPQTLGLAPAMREAGASVVWRCHIGVDRPDQTVREVWDFLTPYAKDAEVLVFSRREYVWDELDPDRVRIMPPSIDPFSPKNQELDGKAVEAILAAIGLGADETGAVPTFTCSDGAPGRVMRPAEIIQQSRLPKDIPTVLQVSRWDRLKDHRGLIECFDRHMRDVDAHLVLAGPASAAVSDDPEGAEVWSEVGSACSRLDGTIRARVHLVALPMDDIEENGAMVNAIQRRADVVVQKSLAEGFGLTVSEAMWKGRPVVGSRVGGIQDQIVDGDSGVLVDDPRDLPRFAAEISALLSDPERALRMGERARLRIRDEYLGATRLIEYVELVARLVEVPRG